jgi:hypothetical protein
MSRSILSDIKNKPVNFIGMAGDSLQLYTNTEADTVYLVNTTNNDTSSMSLDDYQRLCQLRPIVEKNVPFQAPSEEAQNRTQAEIAEIDNKLIAKGMIPLSTMLNSNPLGMFATHVGVNNLDRFEQWLNMRFSEMMGLKSRMLIAGTVDNEMFEWTLAHAAILGEIRTQFFACKPTCAKN